MRRRIALGLALGCIAAAVTAAQNAPPRFHTDPACWAEPRIHHTGAPGAANRERVKLSWRRLPALPSEGDRSPNGAYRVWTRNPSIRDTPPRTATVIVDVERDQTLWIELHDVASPVVPTWINEKLLFVRAWWSRLIGIDVLIDVEAGALVYAEEIDAGTSAFEQYREACGGKCPCALPADEKR